MNTLDQLSLQLLNALGNSETEKQQVSKGFISEIRNIPVSAEFQCPEFEEGLSWINTSSPLSIGGNLKGKVLVLDFWTYCCINCMHILPDLHALEQRFSMEDGVVVIGVHSAKFANERIHENIVNAVQRYKISHAVVNDCDMLMWQEMGIQCWPTIVVVGPDGRLLNQYIGEGHRKDLIEFVECALDVYEDIIDHRPLPISMGESVLSSSLFYPTKVIVHEDELIISDSGHHRVVITSLTGDVKTLIGSGQPGTLDGKFGDCQFAVPQGLCRRGDTIYVADSDAHNIRMIDLNKGVVTTLAGTGVQGNDKLGGKKGEHQSISSPWDVKHYHIAPDVDTGDEQGEDILLIAMAGTHQIWAYFLTDANWWKNKCYKVQTCAAIVGSGSEENRNNSYPMKVALAQPSGLSIDPVSGMCYIADSESSTVRQLNLKDGQVKGLAGGAINPKDLFSFGDEDGKGVEAKLQHPLDVCHIPDSHHVIICDSYNHKLKLLNTKTRQVTSMSVSGLNEPGGLSFHQPSRTLYIADTNNHRIKRISLPQTLDSDIRLSVEEVNIHLDMTDISSSADEPLFDHTKHSVIKVVNDALKMEGSARLGVVQYKLPSNCHLTAGVESSFRVTCMQDGSKMVGGPIKGVPRSLESEPSTIVVDIDLNSQSETQELSIELLVFYCSDTDNTCMRRCILITQPIQLTA